MKNVEILIEIADLLGGLPFKITVGPKTVIIIKTEKKLEVIVIKEEGGIERGTFDNCSNDLCHKVLDFFDEAKIDFDYVNVIECIRESYDREVRFTLSGVASHLTEMSEKYKERYNYILNSFRERMDFASL